MVLLLHEKDWLKIEGEEKLMETGRLHATRVLLVVLVFIAAVLAGDAATALVPIVITFALVLASEELKRIRRPTL